MNYIQLFRIVYTFVFTYILLLVFVFIFSAYALVLLAALVKNYRDNPKRFSFEDTLGINEEPGVVFDKTMAILDKWGICILDKNREEGYIRAVKKYPLNLLDWKILLRFIQENADHGFHTRVAFSVIPEGSLVFLDRMVAKNSTKRFSSYYGISN